MKQKQLLLMVLLLLSIASYAKSVFVVKNQDDFNNISQQIKVLIDSGEEDINIYIEPGRYFAQEKHLKFEDIHSPKTIIRIIGGKNIIVYPSGKQYNDGDKYQGVFTYRNSWMSADQDIDVWTKVKYAEDLVEIVDINKKKCRIKYKEQISNRINTDDSYILIPCWYQSEIYKIDSISNHYIYFTAKNLQVSYHGGYNVNNDYNYGGKGIRYKLFNVNDEEIVSLVDGSVVLPKGIHTVWEGKTDNIISFKNCEFKSLEIDGLHFVGNSFYHYEPLISIVNTGCEQTIIQNCLFSGIKSDVINIESSPNVTIANNNFSDCYHYGILSDNSSKNTVVKNNVFKMMGQRFQNTFCVLCKGENYSIAGNKFFDFGYGGVAVGIWYGREKIEPSCGIVESNEFSYSENYISNIENYGLMDGGAIYVFTKNDGVIIRKNYIHDITGMGDNRGVFCDDGAYNVEIVGNVITDIRNSYCIDSRRCPNVEEAKIKGTGIERSNINIIIRDNIVDGQIRFEAHESDNNGCVLGINYLLQNENSSSIKNEIQNISNIGETKIIKYTGYKKGRIGVSRKSYKLLKKNLEWKHIKRYFTK